MSFDATKPDATESPSLAPSQIQTNWARLQTIISKDHRFNASSMTNDGYHNKVSLINNASAPSVPTDANNVIYSQSVGLGTGTNRSEVFARNSSQSHLIGARAAVLFQGRSSNGDCTLYSAYNVTSVSRTAEGKYTITFTSSLPTAKFCAFAMGQRSGSVEFCNIQLESGTDYTSAQTTSTLKILCFNSSTQLKEPASVSILVFGG